MTKTDDTTGDAFDLTRSQVRDRALAGVFFVTASGFANLVVGFVGNLLVARMLTPNDFGVVAVGLTVTLVGNALADGGLGSGMIRRPEPPSRGELRTLNGIQLAISLALVVPVALVSLGFGTTGAVTAVMMASLPITMLQTPGRVVLARSMRYDRQAAADFVSYASFHVFAVATVALGAGVWGLAAGTVVRATVGAVLTAVLSIGFLLPSLKGWKKFGDLVRFGLRFQANWALTVVREQGINAVTAAISGLTVLGLWTLATRLIQLPIVAFLSLYTVGFPAMSNLLARGEAPGPVILRVVRRAAIGGALILPAFAASSPELVPALFGERWADAADVIPFVAFSTLILSSISVGASSYLNAAGRPGTVALATGAFGAVWIGVTAALLPSLDIVAIGVGNLCGALVEAAILDRATRRTARVAPYRPLVAPLAVALPAGAVGWFVCSAGPSGLAIACAAGALTVVLVVVGLMIVCRNGLMETLHLIARAVKTAIPRLRRSTANA